MVQYTVNVFEFQRLSPIPPARVKDYRCSGRNITADHNLFLRLRQYAAGVSICTHSRLRYICSRPPMPGRHYTNDIAEFCVWSINTDHVSTAIHLGVEYLVEMREERDDANGFNWLKQCCFTKWVLLSQQNTIVSWLLLIWMW